MTIPSEGPSHIRSKVLESSKVAKLESSKVANPSAKLSLHCKTKLNACVVTMKMLLLLRLSILVLAGVASVGGDDADPPRLAAVADAEDVAAPVTTFASLPTTAERSRPFHPYARTRTLAAAHLAHLALLT